VKPLPQVVSDTRIDARADLRIDERVAYDTAILTQYLTPGTDAEANRAGVQALLDRIAPSGLGKGARLFVPPRWDGSGNPDPIVLAQSGANPWCLDLPSNVAIEGAGTGSSLKMAAGVANFTRLLNINGEHNVTVRNLSLDGNRANNNDTYEHNHCIFVYNSNDVVIEDVEAFNATGDGISISGNATKSKRVAVNRVKVSGNKRNAVTLENVDDAWVTHSFLQLAADSNRSVIDSEPFPGAATGSIYLAGNVLDSSLSGTVQYSVTLGGAGPTEPRRNIHLIGNSFLGGGIYGVSMEDAVIAHNTGEITTIYLLGYGRRIAIIGNQLTCTASTYGLDVQPLTGEYTKHLTVANNGFITPNGGGINLIGSENVSVSGNILVGGAVASLPAIRTQATSRSMQRIAVLGNDTDNYTIGFHSTSLSTYRVDTLNLSNNVFGVSGGGYGIDLGTTEHIDNLTLGPNRSPLNRIPASTRYVLAGTPGFGAVWNCSGTPEGVITASVGALALRRDGGAGSTLYVKESGTGSTGWVAK